MSAFLFSSNVQAAEEVSSFEALKDLLTAPDAPEELESDEGADGGEEAGEHGESPEEGREGGAPQKNDSMDL